MGAFAIMPLDFIPHTKRRNMTKARAAKIFLARNGICFNCRQQIRAGQAWFIEHPEAIAQGGSDDDADLWPSHNACKAGKDAVDAAVKAKRDRLVTASWKPEHRSTWAKQRLGNGNNQHTATRPLRPRKSDLNT
jgi:hypothetical protein